MHLAMLYGFILLDGWYLLLLMAGLLITTSYFVEHERPTSCTITILAILAIFEFMTPYHPITAMIKDPITAAMYVIGYIAIGTIYIFPKWWSFVRAFGRRFDAIKDELLRNVANEEKNFTNRTGNYFITGSPKDDGFVTSFSNLSKEGELRLYEIAAMKLHVPSVPLQVYRYKSMIYMWQAAWPVSMIWTLINDPVYRAWCATRDFIYSQIHDTLQSMSANSVKLK